MYYPILCTKTKRNVWTSVGRITVFNLDPEVEWAGEGIQLSFTHSPCSPVQNTVSSDTDQTKL